MDEIRKRRFQVHKLNRNRKETSEYHRKFSRIKTCPDKFKEYTRMNINTFKYILSNVKSSLYKEHCNLHSQPILAEERLVITLRFLITGLSYNDLGFAFSVGKTTVFSIVEETLNAIWDKLQPVHIPDITTEQLSQISEEFWQKRQFPHCVGAIDCKHVRMKKPAHSGSKYWCFKKFYSTKLQAVVDPSYRFISIDVGGYGSEHDASTLRASSFYEALQIGVIQVPKQSKLPDSNIIAPYYFIGDGAYPLMTNLLKPYAGKKLPLFQKVYNEIFSNARVVVECAFGIMSKMWKIFHTTMQHSPEKVEMIVQCTCLLHNIIIDLEGPQDSNKKPSKDDLEAIRNVFPDADDETPSFDGPAKQLQHLVMKYLWKNI